MSTLSIEDILRGTEPGRMQSVGHMQVIPLLGDDDDRYAAPEVEIRTSSYGTVELRHDGERPTIIPPGAGWVVEQAAQDHAVGGGLLLAGKSKATVTTARCIQRSQHGYIRAAKHPMLILPAALRTRALAIRNQVGFSELWDPIAEFNASVGATRGGHLEYFLRKFKAQLDQFVAEFELVPRQVGAVVLVGGQIAGVERAPSTGFWRAVWEPLIRVCYGSLAVERGQHGDAPPSTRVPLEPGATSVGDLRMRVALAKVRERQLAAALIDELRELEFRTEADQTLDGAVLLTLASTRFAGQVVRDRDRIAFASLTAASLRATEPKPSEPPRTPEASAPEAPVPVAEASCAAPVGAPSNGTSSWLTRLRHWLLG